MKNTFFPGLSTSQNISERVALLESRNRPSFVKRPNIGSLNKQFSMVYIESLGRSWPDTPANAAFHFLVDRMRHILSAIAAANLPCCFILQGKEQELNVFMGCSKKNEGLISATLKSQFEGMTVIEDLEENPLLEIDSLPYCDLLKGIPSDPTGAFENGIYENMPLEQIDQLIRALLYMEDWAFVVFANPISFHDSENLVDQWALAVEQAKLEFHQPGTPGEMNRLGEHLIDLLETQFIRAKNGRTFGNWLTQTYILSKSKNAAPLALGIFSDESSQPEPLCFVECSSEKHNWDWTPEQSTWLNSDELSCFIQLPTREYPGYPIKSISRFDLALSSEFAGEGINLGWVQDVSQPTGQAIRLEKYWFVGHTLIAGTTNSGKTNTAFNLLGEFFQQDIPFLVIEPTKGEYRNLKAAFPKLKLFTMGSPEAPLRINPFYVPSGVPVQAHLDFLFSLFSASFVLYAPMPYVLEAALHEIYADKGWDLTTNLCRRADERNERAFPTLTDLYNKIEIIVDRLGYDKRITHDVRAALKTRINSLRIGTKGIMLDTRAAFDFSTLLQTQVVIEMRGIGDDEQKAFLIGLLLMRLYEHYISEGIQVGKVNLKHITVIEEAHRLLQNIPLAQSGDFANPRGKAIETFSNIITEIRGYGEGFVIVEQSPVKLTPDVLKNTNLKLIHRIISLDDREALAGVMNIDEHGQQVLVSLPRGNAIFFAGGMDRPMLVRQIEAKERLTKGSSHFEQQTRSAAIPNSFVLQSNDPNVRLAFLRWLLTHTFCENSVKVDQAQERLKKTIRSATPFAISNLSIENNIVNANIKVLSDRLATQIGNYYSWPFSEEANYQNTIQNLWLDDSLVREAKELLETGTQVNVEPFTGCNHCLAVCQYRVFSSIALQYGDETNSREQIFNKYIDQPIDSSINQISLFARFISNKIIDPDAEESRHIALCISLQQANVLGWQDDVMHEFADRIWSVLNS